MLAKFTSSSSSLLYFHQTKDKELEMTETPSFKLPERQKKFVDELVELAPAAIIVAVGVWFGGGRHLRHIARDVRVSRKQLEGMSAAAANMIDYLELKELAREQDVRLISRAVHQGVKFKHYPGLGVFFPDANAAKALLQK